MAEQLDFASKLRDVAIAQLELMAMPAPADHESESPIRRAARQKVRDLAAALTWAERRMGARYAKALGALLL